MPVSTASPTARGKPQPSTDSGSRIAHSQPLFPQSPGAGPGQPEASPRCTHCEEFGTKGGGSSVYWRLHLDRDLLETIISIYPEWFKDCDVSAGAMAEGGSSPPPSPASGGGIRRKSVSSSPPPHSPPKAQVDDSPLQKSMDRNKESLKVKLMLRRPINQLVAQGIMPPLKTPPGFHEQRQKLERAKTGDLLKAKIQQRPNRTELVRQHILEADMGHVDPSLAERQRMLKKARLQDTLNDQLSHRPGPLELIQKNILHTEEIIERAVKEGQISFKATCEGHLSRPQHPSHYVTFEEDSGGSSEGAAASPPSQPASSSSVPPDACIPHSPSLASTTSSLSPLSSISSPQSVALPPPLPTPPPPPKSTPPQQHPNFSIGVTTVQMTVPSPSTTALSSSSVPQVTASALSAVLSAQKEQVSSSSSKNRKKSKTKSQPKTRTIKFHEYKGPPNAQRSSSSLVSPPPVETSYELLLQQQQLFLQWQLEWQHKYPQIILPAAQKPSDVGLITVTAPSASSTPGNQSSSSVPPPTPPPQPPPPSTTPVFLQAQSPGFSASQGSVSSVASPAATTSTVSSPSMSSVSVSSSLNQSPKDLAALRCLPAKMEDMKVSDLKAELKKRNLPVSGSKPQLIERLRSFAEATPSAGASTCVQMEATSPAPPPPPPPPPPSHTPSHSPFPSPSQHSVFGTESNAEDSLQGLQMESPVVSPSGASMDALPSPSASPPPSLFIQNKVATPTGTAMTLQVFSPASEMDVDPESAVVVILAPPASSSTPTLSPASIKPTSPPASPPLRPPPPPPPLPPPPVQSSLQEPASPAGSEGSIVIGNDIIAQQQKKIEELQRELLRSQIQLQCERQKEQRQLLLQQQLASQTQPRSGNQAPTASTTAGDLKPTHRLVLQQHLQNKIQQQQLQVQLQQLQNMQLQQKQQQLHLQQQKQKPNSTGKVSSQQQTQPSASAKASLAAFLQNQNSTITANNNNILPSTAVSNNNNNNNNNSKKGVSLQQESKVLFNQINLVNKIKPEPLETRSNKTVSTPNGVISHHRTASLPNFFGAAYGSPKPNCQLQSAQSVDQQVDVTEIPKGMDTESILSSSPPSPSQSPQQFLITKPPPHYEEATKLRKESTTNNAEESSDESTKNSKSIKSQIVDDVLEILIKNGELPPSAANDPATPTTPGRSLPQGLIFTSSTTAPATTQSSAPSGTIAQQNVSQVQPTFSTLILPEVKTEEMSTDKHMTDSEHLFHPFDFVLGADASPTPLHRVTSQENASSHHDNHSSQELIQQNEDLGLDLEALDVMEFDLLGGSATHTSVPHVDMVHSAHGREHLAEPQLHNCIQREEDVDMEAAAGPGSGGELSEMPMDLDVSDWLDSLIAPTVSQHSGSSSFHHQSAPPQYDPLLSHSHDPFDLFDDAELRMASWDRVDFAA